MNFKYKLRAIGLSAALALTALAGTAHAAVVDFEFTTKSWSNGLNGGTGSNLAGVQGAGFTYGGVDVFLAGGFFHNGAKNAGIGVPVYSLGAATYGPGNEPSAYTGSAVFSSSGYIPAVTTSITGGNIGFRTAAGNYGYIVFDWDYPSRTMTFLSGQYETVVGAAISTSAVPLPAGLPFILTGLLSFGVISRRKKD